MKNEIILWLSSILIVFLIGYTKNVTDKNYPITGTFGIKGQKVSYKLDKVSFDKKSYKNIIISDINGITGKLIQIEDGEEKETAFKEIDRGLECEIPKLKPGKEIKYKVVLNYADKTFEIPEKDFVTLTFWGNIPSPVNILYFILMYGGLLMVLRSLLELFNNNKNSKKYALITCTLFITLVTIVAPLKNSCKLGAINNYVPQITDLLEPVLLIILLVWIAGTILIFNKKYVRIV
ncbi:MAG: hypothetical protein OEM46_07680, partial [Ignavibacteria bacterium]|nr:hypothetical protein [Ignavibacteria bacterium]